MGRYRGGGKLEADSLKKIDLSWLKKQCSLKGYISGSMTWRRNSSDKGSSISFLLWTAPPDPYLKISYTRTNRDETKTDFDYKIPLTTTPCHFGGLRYWFICPWYKNGVYCGRRVGKIYLGRDYFACRHCYSLTYASRKLSGFWKSMGNVIGTNDLDEQRSSMRVTHYAGKPTKRFQRWAKRYTRADRQMERALVGLYATRRTIT
ncbi:MAG: hypothetical protein ABSE04_01665 [Candidatus Microgenomates bacterium]|jgi:hypothetical protein